MFHADSRAVTLLHPMPTARDPSSLASFAHHGRTRQMMQAMSPAATTQEDTRRVSPSMMAEATAAAMRLSSGHFVAQCLYTFTKIGAPDAMAGDELSPSEIAARLDQ